MRNSEHSTFFSQHGEDIIVEELFDQLGVSKPTYLDIGAYHPYDYSNTALLYALGSTGVNVEPHPERIKRFNLARPRDLNLAVGVAATCGELTYYDFGEKDIVNTFSLQEARKSEARGHRLRSTSTVPIRSIGHIVDTYCQGQFPDFLSIDAEGLDYEILESMTHYPNRPSVICAETLAYTDTLGEGTKLHELIALLVADGYHVCAETPLNTIFSYSLPVNQE